jgi:HK97 family phage major capsid protein/HK97 family phage prohead protease
MSVDMGGRVRRALDGDESLLVTRSVALDDIHIRAGGTGRDVVAYAAVWMSPTEIVDQEGHYREQNARDAMTKSIADRAGRIFSVYNHAKTLAGTPSDTWSVPLGKPLEIRADAKGLLTVTRYDKDPETDRILEKIKSGSLKGMSYTGVFLRSDPPLRPYEQYTPDRAGELTLVTRQEIALIEYGPTPNPAFQDAEIVGVRNRPQRELIIVQDIPVAGGDRALGMADMPSPGPTMGADMPYEVMHDTDACPVDKPWAVKKKGDGKLMGCHASQDDAHKQMAALYANETTSSSGRDDADEHERADDPKKPYGDVTYADPGLQSDGKKRYPIDTAEHCKAAWSYINQADNAGKYSSDDLAKIKGRIKSAAKKFGIEIQSETSSSGRQPAPEHHRTEPHPHSAAPTNNQNRSTSVDNDRQSMTVEERVARQSEIRARLAELDTEYSGAELPQEARAEWNGLQQEMVVHERSIADANSRADYLRYINDTNPGATERVDNTRTGYGQEGDFQARMGGSGPAFHASRDIYDLAAIRNRARHIDEVPTLYRDYAMRAVEQGRYPGATGRNGAPNKEEAQTRIATLLDTIDDEHGTLARRILVTGSPLYDRAFGKMLGRQSVAGLTAEESRALSLGTDSAGGYAVPFQLDPTVILTSNGVVNPLRQISRVETITGKEWDGVSSAGVTVSRGTEGQEVGTGDPALAQPSVRTQRVQGFVPFSIELDVSWNALRSQMTALLQDAKDVEEATAFATGNGTAPNPSGVVSTLGTASYVQTAGSGALAAGDIYLLENAMAPRFIANSSIVASKTIYNKFRTLFQAQASAAGDPFARPSGAMGPQFNGYPKYELSTMSSSTGSAWVSS